MIKITNIFIILFLTLIGSFLKAKSPEEMIKESIANYPGKCPCPYSIMSNGKKCGKRSAYSKPGGYEPLCYISDIKNNIIKEKLKNLILIILFRFFFPKFIRKISEFSLELKIFDFIYHIIYFFIFISNKIFFIFGDYFFIY